MRWLKYILPPLLIIAIGLVMQYTGLLAAARYGTTYTTRGIGQLMGQVVDTAIHLPRGLKNLRDLQTANNRLSADITRLTKENAELHQRLQVAQAEQTESAVRFDETVKFRLGAHIIGREPDTVTQQLRLDKGERQGVKRGMAVVSNGVLIARIEHLEPNESLALVITSNRSVVQVRHETSRTTAIVRGGLDGLHLESVPLDTRLATGDRIITSGLDGLLPPALLVGTISEVLSDQSSFLQSAKLSQPLQANRLEFVEIVGRS